MKDVYKKVEQLAVISVVASFVLVSSSTLSRADADDEVVPATSEDIQQFDAAVERNRVKNLVLQKSEKKGNFGDVVSEEAKKLKDQDLEGQKNFGSWVSGQRRQDVEHKADAATTSHGVRDAVPGKNPASASGGNSSGGASGSSGGNRTDHPTGKP